MDKSSRDRLLPSLVHCSLTTNDDKTPMGIIAHLKLKRNCKRSLDNDGEDLVDFVVFLDEIFTIPNYRKGGVAALLLHHVVSLEKYNTCKFVDLLVDATNKEARSWYERLGFYLLSSDNAGDSASDRQDVFSSVSCEQEHLRAVRMELQETLQEKLTNRLRTDQLASTEFETFASGQIGRIGALVLLKSMNEERGLQGKPAHPFKKNAELTMCFLVKPRQTL